eukprot:880683-Amphidinium_carterae.1
MRKMLPSHEFSRIGIAKDILRMPQYTLNTFSTAAAWIENFLNRLAVAVKVGSKMEARELHYVLHGSLELVLKDLDLGLSWQATSRDVQVRSAQFGVSDVQTLGSTMLVEMRMRDEEQRAKQLVIKPSATRTPQAASGEYEADQWTTQEWEEYEAE